MDIHIANPTLARAAVDHIFGDDISKGPVRKAPDRLLEIQNSWPKYHENGFVRALLNMPLNRAVVSIDRELARGETPAFQVHMHRVQIISEGKLVGHALRMDALSLSTLAAWENACQVQLRRLRQVH